MRSRPLTYLLLSTGYLLYWLSGLLLIVFAGAAMIVAYPLGVHRKVFRYTVYRYLRFFVGAVLPALGVYRIRCHRRPDPTSMSKHFIVVANHCGKLDGLLLLANHQNLIPTMKSVYTRRPVYYVMMKCLGMVSLDTDSRTDLARALSDCRHIIEQRCSLLVFPEGTRSRSNRILPFKPLAFRLAVDTGTPVLPVLITSDLPFMAKSLRSYFPDRTLNYDLYFMDPVRPAPNESAKQFASRVQRLYVDMQKKRDPIK